MRFYQLHLLFFFFFFFRQTRTLGGGGVVGVVGGGGGYCYYHRRTPTASRFIPLVSSSFFFLGWSSFYIFDGRQREEEEEISGVARDIYTLRARLDGSRRVSRRGCVDCCLIIIQRHTRRSATARHLIYVCPFTSYSRFSLTRSDRCWSTLNSIKEENKKNKKGEWRRAELFS